jgi:hypothetical protein
MINITVEIEAGWVESQALAAATQAVTNWFERKKKLVCLIQALQHDIGRKICEDGLTNEVKQLIDTVNARKSELIAIGITQEEVDQI